MILFLKKKKKKDGELVEDPSGEGGGERVMREP